VEVCSENWWRNLLNIQVRKKNSAMTSAIMKRLVFVTSNFAFQNFWTVEEMCVPWSWFLALDFQFFLLALLILAAFLYVPPVAPVRS
jgi:hypothetical protein